MSITDIPLVVAYRSALENALSNSSKKIEESQNVVVEFREIRNDGISAGETSAHDLVVENVIREKFTHLVSTLEIHQPEFQQVWDLIDIANVVSENELSEPSLAFYLVEELLDSQTIDGCRKVFDYLESRRDRMVRKNFKTKSLVILRCCNELLRRLSRAEETVFCGRVFIYLFQTFPLGDRSSVNLRGVFHTENVTTYDESTEKSDHAIQPMEIDGELGPDAASGGHTPLSTAPDTEAKTGRSTPSIKPSKSEQTSEPPPDLDKLYPLFWSLQGLFSDPTRLFDPKLMQHFKDGVTSTLSCFRHVARNSAPTMEALDTKRGTKRKHDETLADQNTSTVSKFNPKYLTSRDLFDLEIHDIAFRRHFLVQALIMLDFLLSLSPTGKVKTVGLTNRSVLYAYTLSEEDTKWAQSTRHSIATYLQQSGIGTEGSLYYRMVDTVLSRDKNWARWKAENCPPISRPPINAELYLKSQKSLKEISKAPPLVNPPGASDFNFLMHAEPLESLKKPSERHKVPTLQEYYKNIQGDDLDLEMAMGDEEKHEIEEKKAGRLWRALRSANGKKFVLCEQIKNGENLAALIDEGGVKIDGEDDDAKIEVGDEGADDEPKGRGTEEEDDVDDQNSKIVSPENGDDAKMADKELKVVEDVASRAEDMISEANGEVIAEDGQPPAASAETVAKMADEADQDEEGEYDGGEEGESKDT